MTTTYDKLDTINDSLNDIKTAIIGKGQTPSGNITTYATAIDNIVQSSPVIDSLSITPTTSAQTITAPSGTDGYSPVNVAAVTASIDNNIVASNIVSGVSILGVNGSATVLNGETVNITPTTSAQTITPTSPKNGITQANVAAVTSSIDANITAENIKKDVTILNVIGTYEGSGGGGGKYKIGDRVYSSSNVDIGVVYCFYIDGNGVEYAVVCLNATHRLASGQWASDTGYITNMPNYGNIDTAAFGIGTETATVNGDLILATTTSNAVTHCRSKSFTIDGITYKGQLPNICEALAIFAMHSYIEAHDPTASSAGSTLNFTSWKPMWSSSQYGRSKAWVVGDSGYTTGLNKTDNYLVVPVLEIPNN